MKKLLSALALGAMAISSVAVVTDETWAADLTGEDFSIDCDSGAILASGGRTITASVGVGDTFDVTNGGSTDACVFTDSDNVVTGEANIATGASLQLTIAKSGSFSISSAGSPANPVTIVIDACSLSGAGLAADPWWVTSDAEFQTVGEEGDGTSGNESFCSMDGYYIQGANLTLDNYPLDIVGNGSTAFTGTYDGNHYQISLGGDVSGQGWRYDSNGDTDGGFQERKGLFPIVDGGTLKRINLTGEMRTSASGQGPLVGSLYGGGVVSEVRSSVNLELSANFSIAGGIVGQLGLVSDSSGGRVQYSKYSGTIEWLQASTGDGTGVYIGGIAGWTVFASEIRDSYSRLTALYDTGDLTTSGGEYIYVGGILGGEPRSGDLATTLVRNYATVSASDLYPTGSGVSVNASKDSVGGLIGYQNQSGTDTFVSNSWLSSGASNAAGTVGSGSQLVDYDATGPVAVPVSAAFLRSISTYQTAESSPDSGEPGGTALASTSNSSTFDSSDYRWAITGSTQTFVPSSYVTVGTFSTRQDWPTPASNPKSYTRETTFAAPSIHRGDDQETSTTYPVLGNVWEICSYNNDGYPTLVWEEEDCVAPGGGGSSGGSSSASTAALASAAGLTEAEYAEFLASGLTLEQFKAARLAATGPDGSRLASGMLLALLLLVGGASILLTARRGRSLP